MTNDSLSSSAADVIVIGGGIIGCSIALRLAQASLKVQVFDRGEPGAEASTAAAGMLAPQGEKIEPKEFLDLCRASHALYPDFVTEIEELSGSHVGYRRDGTLLLALSETEEHDLQEIHQTQKDLLLPPEPLSAEAARKLAPGLAPSLRSALFLPQDHWVDNERLTRSVIRASERQGVSFVTRSRVKGFNVRKDRVESVDVEDLSGVESTVFGDKFILAAGCWSGDVAGLADFRVETLPCRGQMLEFECRHDFPLVVRAGHHYLVPRSARRLVLGTTAEYVGYEKTVTAEGMRSVLEGVERIVPLISDALFKRAWAGLRPDTADHLPILGYDGPSNLVFATGHFRNGILLAPATAQLVSELVLTGSTSHPLDVYRPGRFQDRLITAVERSKP